MVTTRGKQIDFKIVDSDEDNDEPAGSTEQSVKKALPRKKARVSKAKDDTYSAVEASGSISGPSTSSRTGPRPSRRSGKLRDLMQMPVDIFANICAYLGPRDLRTFSMTTKRLRDILMSRESRHIWRDCLASVPGLPECPPDLGEPQYVRLLFSSECFGCDGRGTLVDYFHRKRYCAFCFDRNILMLRDIFMTLEDSTLRTYACSANVPCDARMTRNRARSKRVYLESTVLEIKAEADQLETWSKEDQQAFHMKWLARKAMLEKTGRAMFDYKRNSTWERNEELEVLKNAHQQSVEVRLLDMGWLLEDIPRTNTRYKSLVRKPKPLTEKGELILLPWPALREKLQPILQDSRESRLHLETLERRMERRGWLGGRYRELVLETLQQHHSDEARRCPSLTQFFDHLTIRELIQDDTKPVEGEELWLPVVDEIREWVLKYNQDLLQALVDVLDGSTVDACLYAPDVVDYGEEFSKFIPIDPHGKGKRPMPIVGPSSPEVTSALTQRLSKLSSAFRCEICNTLHWFPQVVLHIRSHNEYRAIGSIIQPLTATEQTLMARLARDINPDLDLTTCELEVVDYCCRTNVLCLRCDERLAPHRGFIGTVKHFMDVRNWHTEASMRLGPGEAELYDDHDWDLEGPFVRVDDEDQKAATKELQVAFQTECLRDKDDDELGIGGEDFESNYYRRFLGERLCKLCPAGYSPKPAGAATVKIHIQAKHRKTLNLDIDTIVDYDDYLVKPCPLF